MLDKNERQFLAGSDPNPVIQGISGTLYQAGIVLTQTGPNTWAGRGNVASYGMVPKVAVSVMPMQGGFFVDARIGPDFESNGLIIFLVAWLFFFPLAIVLGVMGYQDWQTRHQQLSGVLWSSVGHLITAPPAPQWGGGAMAPGPWGGGQA